MASCETCRALIRHPRLWRPDLPAAGGPPAPVNVDACPLPVLLHVCSFLDCAKDVLNFGAVCRVTRAAAGDEELWRRLTLSAFPVPLGKPAPPDGWRGLYRGNHRVLRDVLLNPNLRALLNEAYPL